MLTRPFPDVLSGNAHPPVPLWRRDHRFEEGAVGLLDLAPASQLGFGLLQPHGKAVANPLELGHAEHARPTDGRDPPLDAGAGKGGGEELAEPPLELPDLAAQLAPRPLLGTRIRDSPDRQRVNHTSRLVS